MGHLEYAGLTFYPVFGGTCLRAVLAKCAAADFAEGILAYSGFHSLVTDRTPNVNLVPHGGADAYLMARALST